MIGLLLLARLGASGMTSCPVTLAWNASQNNMTAGYALYYGPVNAAPARVDVGSSTSITLTSLTAGSTYSFYVVAYDSLGQESVPSNQLTYTPSAISRAKCSMVGGNLSVQFRSAVGSLCGIEYKDSMDPNTNWLTKYKTNAWSNPWLPLGTATADASGNVSIPDPQASQTTFRIYRAVRY